MNSQIYWPWSQCYSFNWNMDVEAISEALNLLLHCKMCPPYTATMCQFHGCLFYGHDCYEFEDAWLITTAKDRHMHTEENEKYRLFVTTYSWLSGSGSGRAWSAQTPMWWQPLPSGQELSSMSCSCHCPVPVCSYLGLICRWSSRPYARVVSFGLTQVDVHTPEGLNNKFC